MHRLCSLHTHIYRNTPNFVPRLVEEFHFSQHPFEGELQMSFQSQAIASRSAQSTEDKVPFGQVYHLGMLNPRTQTLSPER